MRRRILLIGLPGCGKTTVVRKVADLLGGAAAGFYTDEVRDDNGQRIGFQVTSLEGKRGELARKGTRSGPRVGSYCVNVKDFERIALPSLEVEERRVLLIDEIGKMECFSKEFVRRRKDVEPILVTLVNRDELPEQLVAKLTSRPAT